MNNITPDILKESSGGYYSCRIEDEMFMNREIQCTGEINDDTCDSLSMQLRYLNRVDPEQEIRLFVNSPGGEVSSGLAIYDVMKSISCPIRTICLGMASSMAAILFISGDHREMMPHARIMIHDPLIRDFGGSALQVKSLSDDLLRTREITASIIAEHTGRTLEEIFEATSKDTYFNAREAVEYGLADSIINISTERRSTNGTLNK